MAEFKAVTSGLAKYSGITGDASAKTSAAGSADSAAMNSSVAAALGPIAADYVAHWAPAQCNNLAATKRLARVYDGISGQTDVSMKATIRMDEA